MRCVTSQNMMEQKNHAAEMALSLGAKQVDLSIYLYMCIFNCCGVEGVTTMYSYTIRMRKKTGSSSQERIAMKYFFVSLEGYVESVVKHRPQAWSRLARRRKCRPFSVR